MKHVWREVVLIYGKKAWNTYNIREAMVNIERKTNSYGLSGSYGYPGKEL